MVNWLLTATACHNTYEFLRSLGPRVQQCTSAGKTLVESHLVPQFGAPYAVLMGETSIRMLCQNQMIRLDLRQSGGSTRVVAQDASKSATLEARDVQ